MLSAIAVLLLSLPTLLALSQSNADWSQQRSPGLPPPLYLHPYSGDQLQQIVNVLAQSLETRRLPSGETLYISRLVVPTLEADNSLCQNHTRIYWDAITKEMWAQRMLDATGKLTDGVLEGNINAFGSWGECLGTEVALKHSEHPYLAQSALNFTGRMVSTLFYPNIPKNTSLAETPDNGGGDNIGGFVVLPRLGMATGIYGICLPSSCSTEDARTGLQKQLGGNVTVMALESHVQDEPVLLTSSDKLVIAMMAIVGILMAVGTAVDLYDRGCLWQLRTEAGIRSDSNITLIGSSEPAHKSQASTPARRITLPALQAFSVYTNTLKLMDTSQSSDVIRCLHGIRFLSMTWVVMGHAAGDTLVLNGNPMLGMDLVKGYLFAAIDNASVSVDTFFLLSGVLLAYGFFRSYEKTKRLNIGMMYIHRYLRLTAPYVFMIAISATWARHIGNGPIWFSSTDNQAQWCQTYWWRNLLYIQNLCTDLTSYCLGQSWYLDNDMQMFVFSPLVLVPLVWRPLLGMLWLLFVTVAFLALRITIWSTRDVAAAQWVFPHPGEDAVEAGYLYMYPWMRCTVWLTGIGLGYLLYRRRGRRTSLSLWLVWAAWVAAAAVGILVVYGMTGYQMPWQPAGKAVSVAYGGLNRFAWGLAVSWVIFACHTGYGGWVNALLSYRAFIPLSRLTYVGYLVHINVLTFGSASAKGIIYYDPLRLVYWLLSQIILTFCVSYAFSMAFEVPFATLERLVFSAAPPAKPKLQEKGAHKAAAGTSSSQAANAEN